MHTQYKALIPPTGAAILAILTPEDTLRIMIMIMAVIIILLSIALLNRRR